MYYTRDRQKRFLDKELSAISESYIKLLKTKAIALLSSNDVYVTQFVKLDYRKVEAAVSETNMLGTGQIMLRFKKDKGIPRKNEYFTAVLLDGSMCLPKNWGNKTWAELRRFQVEFSEVHCVWQGKEDDKGYLLCGFSGVSLSMANYLKDNNLEGCVVILGPQEPPIDYYQNLINIVENKSSSMPARQILDFDEKALNWSPSLINSNKEQVESIIHTLDNKDELIFQGPPGTGKTYLMAELVSNLLDAGKSVLVTAMTNRALIELASKDSLKRHLSSKHIMKTNVSADEILTCRNIVPISGTNISCMQGSLTLSTFYVSSGWAKICSYEPPFDYVIMDEASQALYAMIAACKNLGQKVIWIGDQNQMQPIVLQSGDGIARNDYGKLVNGFQTLCDNFDYKSFMLTETHRLLPDSAKLTSLFYHVALKSVASHEYIFKNHQYSFLPLNGGTKLYLTDMPLGDTSDRASCLRAIQIVEEILNINSKISIAVLSKFRDTVRMLQNCFISKYGSKENVLIDTVERVQGLTCDLCLYFIPNEMMGLSLDRYLFNVATSRAKQATIIMADKAILQANCDKHVQQYLYHLTTNSIISKDNNITTTGKTVSIEGSNINIKIKDKIDLTQFETKKQKSVKSVIKDNIYIIDTNVFVNCPDIISKIDQQYKVVLSAKVIDELDKLKITLDAEGKRNVEKALRNINRALDKPRVTMELSDISLLPSDFNKRSPDNNILTVALKFQNDEENPILLTSDNGLQVKAKGLGIATISLKDFLRR